MQARLIGPFSFGCSIVARVSISPFWASFLKRKSGPVRIRNFHSITVCPFSSFKELCLKNDHSKNLSVYSRARVKRREKTAGREPPDSLDAHGRAGVTCGCIYVAQTSHVAHYPPNPAPQNLARSVLLSARDPPPKSGRLRRHFRIHLVTTAARCEVFL